ncbi:MAG: hypothetical protein KAV83_00285 [Desulfobacterales bacterium]|nr:hypothetical protein [Desulfobacterales bacterium]
MAVQHSIIPVGERSGAMFKPFSIIIRVYNEQDVIVRNIESLMAYLMRRKRIFEIIIGSNGSVQVSKKILDIDARIFDYLQ